MQNSKFRHKAFTLIELLVVIAIIAIISIIVVIVLNPSQLLAQSRDANRLSDLSTLNTAVGIFSTQVSNSLGSSNVIYVSLPDSTATSTAGTNCAALSLPTLPPSYSYHCAASSTYRTVAGGIGWLPVALDQLPGGSPLGSLPTDPTDQAASRLYYTYTTNGNQFEITSPLESGKYKLGGPNDAIVNDGGSLASVDEKGSKLGLQPMDYGDTSLVGYWSFEEGSSSVAYDYAGSNTPGAWIGTAMGTFGYYSAGKIGQYAGTFDGISTVLYGGTQIYPAFQAHDFSISVWFNANSVATDQPILSSGGGITDQQVLFGVKNNKMLLGFFGDDVSGTISIATGTWYQVVATWSASSKQRAIYINGTLDTQAASTGLLNITASSNLLIGQHLPNYFNGKIDDLRIYNRVLSPAEITSLYVGSK